jgi:hypothetical protein
MTTNDFVWNELKGIEWTADRDDIIRNAIVDGRDTARYIAKKVRAEVKACDT